LCNQCLAVAAAACCRCLIRKFSFRNRLDR